MEIQIKPLRCYDIFVQGCTTLIWSYIQKSEPHLEFSCPKRVLRMQCQEGCFGKYGFLVLKAILKFVNIWSKIRKNHQSSSVHFRCVTWVFRSIIDPIYSLSPGFWQSFISIKVCRDCIPALASSCKKQLTGFFVCLLFFLKVKRIS